MRIMPRLSVENAERVVIEREPNGFIELETVLVVFLLMIIAGAAAPKGYNIIARAALDYEATHLAAELRDMFQKQRTAYWTKNYFSTVEPGYIDDFNLIPEYNGYRIENRFGITVKRHYAYPGVHLRFRASGKSKISVNPHGYTSDNNTVTIYVGDGYKAGAKSWKRRYVIVDRAGRVRIDWYAP